MDAPSVRWTPVSVKARLAHVNAAAIWNGSCECGAGARGTLAAGGETSESAAAAPEAGELGGAPKTEWV